MKILSILILLSSVIFAFGEDWEEVGEMKYPVSGGEIIARDSLIYIVGGYSDSLQANVNWIQKYNSDYNSWKIVAGMKTARSGFQVGIYNDNLYIFGGVSGDQDTLSASILEVWDFTSDSTSVQATNKQFDRIFSTGFIRNDKMIIIGGYGNFISWDVQLPYIVYYDFAADSFFVLDDTSYQTGNLPLQQIGLERNGVYYLFGGDYNGVLQSYDEITFTDNSYGYRHYDSRDIEPRAGGSAIYDDDYGIIYLIGGYNESNYSLATVDLITSLDSVTVVKGEGPELIYPRRNLMSIMFEDTIFVFGGESKEGTVVRQVEKLSYIPTDVNDIKSEDRDYTKKDFVLKQNYPNPFNPTTKITYSVKDDAEISLNIYNTLGQKVAELFRGHLSAGSYSYEWDGKDYSGNELPSGVYFCRLSSGDRQIVKKMLLLK